MEDLFILLNKCPILEEVHAEYLNLNNLDISFAQKAVKKRFPYFPNLIRASITNASFYTKHSIALICRLSVQVLRIELDLPLSSYNRYPFCNLTCMELILKLNHCDKWLWLLELLKHCPKLQSLIIYEDYWNNGEDVVDNWTDPKMAPNCLSTQLNLYRMWASIC
ncbi:uncharacterized protein LOC131613885 [Vicia villosa]|uniref:uncharacterized protein LOC131613885 n=1 Tax=Vicia villosa TaxID=3911 RepID=UPI00273B2357|nr:uncharacterized protein LOC131613885 [Vicia villosa]